MYHLTAANAIHILMQCTTVLPIMLAEVSCLTQFVFISRIMQSDEDSANRFWYKVGSYLIMITEQASLYFTLLMTINRFAVFVCPSMLAVFTASGIHLLSSIIWVYINFIVFWNYNYGTTKVFSRKTISTQEVLLGTNFLTKVITVTQTIRIVSCLFQFFTLSFTILPLVMLGMYIVICAFIIKKRNVAENQKRNDRDMSLVVQALIITVALECVNLTDMITPFLKNSSKSVQWVWTIFAYW